MQKLNRLVLIGALAAVTAITGCTSRGDAQRTAGRVVDDNRIKDKVETALNNEPIYKFKDVDVKTFNGVVQLSGFVTTEEQKRRAGEIAQQIPGVVQVVNSLALKMGVTPTGRATGTNGPTAAPIGRPDTNNIQRDIDHQ